MVQRTIHQKKEAMKGALMEILEEPVMKEEVEVTLEEDPIKPCTKSYYSCGEEHISQNCRNGDLVEFPTEEVEYDPQEIETLIGTEKSRKRNRLDTRKDLSHITCFGCKDSGHCFSGCPNRKPSTQGGYAITRKPQDL